jgi:RNA polymerase primary sigma factor
LYFAEGTGAGFSLPAWMAFQRKGWEVTIMHSNYSTAAIRQLRDNQVREAPRDRIIEQADLAERLLGEIDPSKNYSFDYLYHRITRNHTNDFPQLNLSGSQARHDLKLFVEDASDVANLSSSQMAERVVTVEQLSEEFNVSTKTISRWREQGLVSRRFLIDGRKRVGFLQSSVDRFVSNNSDRIERGARFSQMSKDEKLELIQRARRMIRFGGCPSEVTKRLASLSGRSIETIRYTIRQYDREHPDGALFPNHAGPLKEKTKQKIFQQFRQGDSVDALAKRFCRTKTSIYRIVNEVRAKTVFDLPLDYIPNENFETIVEQSREEESLLGPIPEDSTTKRKSRLPSGLPSYLASLYEVSLLDREQEAHLFRKMNYLKFKATKTRDELDSDRPRAAQMDRIEQLYNEAIDVKNVIARSNLRLVVSIAKRHVGPMEDFFELVSDGNISLLRAIEKFDFARGNKFSTYASWAIMKNFARTIPVEHRQRDRFRVGNEELFVATEDERTDQITEELAYEQRQKQIKEILGYLDQRERDIICYRFGLKDGHGPLTLKQVGSEIGVTKERVRQIESRALTKLRAAANAIKLELPEPA